MKEAEKTINRKRPSNDINDTDFKDIKQLSWTYSINAREKERGDIKKKKDPNQTSRDEKYNAWDKKMIRY